MAPDLIFSVREILDQGGLAASATGTALEFIGGTAGLDEAVSPMCLAGALTLNLRFSVGGERILLEGDVSGEWTAACSRCLKPHPAALQNAIEQTYPMSDERIDAREEVRQAVLLSFPERSLCRPACRGLCPSCGKELNCGDCGCPHPDNPPTS